MSLAFSLVGPFTLQCTAASACYSFCKCWAVQVPDNTCALSDDVSKTLNVVCSVTSAVPKMKGPPEPGQRPDMYFEEGGMPEQVCIVTD